MKDVVIVGGGVVGLTLAYELAGQGVEVAVLEQGELGKEASWAGAGILPPGNPDGTRSPEALLRAESCRLWPGLTEELREATGIDNGYRRCGGIQVRLGGSSHQLDDEIAAWGLEGVEVAELSPSELIRHEPEMNRDAVAAYRLPGLAQVRNPRHLKALIAGCAARGVELLSNRTVVGFERHHGIVVTAKTSQETITAGQFCITSGAWSKRLLEEVGVRVTIEPVRGQIVLLSAAPLPFHHVIEVGALYLVTRPDGSILIGSTEEHVGFEKRNTAVAVAELIEFAIEVVPELAAARYEQAWSGLRPKSSDGRPYLGPVPETENLFIAAGHFRSGLQQSPGTARLMREVMLGQEPFIPLDSFACDRHQADVLASG